MDSIVPDMTAFDEANPLALNAPVATQSRKLPEHTADGTPKQLANANYLKTFEEQVFGDRENKKPEEVKSKGKSRWGSTRLPTKSALGLPCPEPHAKPCVKPQWKIKDMPVLDQPVFPTKQEMKENIMNPYCPDHKGKLNRTVTGSFKKSNPRINK